MDTSGIYGNSSYIKQLWLCKDTRLRLVISGKECMSSLSTTYTKSLARTCGVCMDVILTKQMLRKTDVVSYNAAKGCPECRTVSFYFIPSKCWVTDQDEKNEIISLYKTSILSKITCKYFLKGNCVFGPDCFYKHSAGSPNRPLFY